MAQYDSNFTGQHNDRYEDRIFTLENKATKMVTLDTAQTITGAKTLTTPLYFETPGGETRPILAYNATYPNFGISYHEGDPDVITLSASGNANNLTGADLSINGLGDGIVSIRGNTILHAGNYKNYIPTCSYYGSVSGSSHASALQSYFSSYYSSIPRDKLLPLYSSAYGNGSLCMGHWINGYNSNPYGGFFICHYTSAKYVGIANGTYTQYEINKTASSSIRIKDNIKDLSDAEAKKLLQTHPITFDYKEWYGDKNQVGFIAEELEDILPYVVYCPEYDPEKEEKPLQSIDYTKFVPYLVKLAQIQQQEIDELKQEIKELKGKLN